VPTLVLVFFPAIVSNVFHAFEAAMVRHPSKNEQHAAAAVHDALHANPTMKMTKSNTYSTEINVEKRWTRLWRLWIRASQVLIPAIPTGEL